MFMVATLLHAKYKEGQILHIAVLAWLYHVGHIV